jgi:hypothetical protein
MGLHFVNSLALALAGASSLMVVFLSASIWFACSKTCVAPPHVYQWFFFELTSWRHRTRQLFSYSVPSFLLAFAFMRDAWCSDPVTATALATVMTFTSATAFILTRHNGPIPVGAPLRLINERYRALQLDRSDGPDH